MANVLITKNSSSAANVPTAGELVEGELAINTADKKLYCKTATTVFQVFDGVYNLYSLPLATSTVRGGIELFSDTDNPTAANSVSSTASRTYGIQLNAANQAVVNVPWTDTGGIGGSITNDQIAFGAATADDIEGSAVLTWDATTRTLDIGTTVLSGNIELHDQGALTLRNDVDGDSAFLQHTSQLFISCDNGISLSTINDITMTVDNGQNIQFADGIGSGSWYWASATRLAWTQDLLLLDSKALRLGAGGDLALYHNGTDSYIDSVLGTADLYIRTNSNENAIVCQIGSSVSLYYNTALKLATSATGATVTGTLAATTVTGANVTTGADPGHTHTTASITGLSGTNTGDNAVNSLYSGLVTDSGVPAMLSSGGLPVLNTGITAAEYRTAIGAGTGDGTATTFDSLTSKTSGTGTYTTSGTFAAAVLTSSGNISAGSTGTIATGEGGGSVALTINDGQGNANVTFNHIDGVADFAGNVGRIVVNTDSTSGASMAFELLSNAATGAVSSLPQLTITESTIDCEGNTITSVGSITSTGTVAATTVTGANVTTGANPGHTHTGSSISALDAGDITTGTLAVLRGGTGVTTKTGTGSVVLSAAPALTGAATLGGVAIATTATNWSAADITSGTLAVLRGGTGVTTKTGTGSVVLSASPTFTGTLSAATVAATTVTGANVTTGANPGHTHTGSSISGLAAGDTTSGIFAAARIPVATATAVGGIELEDNTVQTVAANAVTATAARTYGVQLNSSGQAVVNVPWTAGGGGALNDLTDVVITAGASGDFLRHNGTNWVDHAGVLATDVNTGSLANGVNAYFQASDSDSLFVIPFTSMTAGAAGNSKMQVHIEKNNGMWFNPNSQTLKTSNVDAISSVSVGSTDQVYINTSGISLNDNIDLFIGTGNDSQIYSNGTDTFWDMASTKDLNIRHTTETMIQCLANLGVSLWHNGGIELRTQQHEGSSITSGVEILDHAGSFRDAGFNHVKEVAVTTVTLSNLHAGNILRKTSTGTLTVTMAASTTEFPVGSMCTIINHGTGGSLTISDGSEAMYIMDGSGTVTDSPGFVLAVGGCITVWRQGASAFYVWGAGIP